MQKRKSILGQYICLAFRSNMAFLSPLEIWSISFTVLASSTDLKKRFSSLQWHVQLFLSSFCRSISTKLFMATVFDMGSQAYQNYSINWNLAKITSTWTGGTVRICDPNFWGCGMWFIKEWGKKRVASKRIRTILSAFWHLSYKNLPNSNVCIYCNKFVINSL